MNTVVHFKDGVLPIFRLAPAGVRLLGAIERAARVSLLHDLTITCADKDHGKDDPHTHGEAFDVRTHDLTVDQKYELLMSVMTDLSDGDDDAVTAKDGGYVTRLFFGWLENAGQENEHVHVQLRNGHTYPS